MIYEVHKREGRRWYTIYMLTFKITGDNVSVSEGERDTIEKRFKGFDRFTEEGFAHEMAITATKTTAHQREDSFRVEVRFRAGQQNFFAVGEAADLIPAADMAKEELMREVTQKKAKRQTLYHRSARKLKNFIKLGRKVKK